MEMVPALVPLARVACAAAGVAPPELALVLLLLLVPGSVLMWVPELAPELVLGVRPRLAE